MHIIGRDKFMTSKKKVDYLASLFKSVIKANEKISFKINIK